MSEELRTWNDGWRCSMCCNGDRCDDRRHVDRNHCKHCSGTGWALWNLPTLERELAEARDKLKAEESPNPFCGHPGNLTDAEDENGANLFCWQCRNADLRAQVEALQQAKRPWTPEHTKSVIDGQVKEIDELTEKLRSERVKHEQEVEALTAERDRLTAELKFDREQWNLAVSDAVEARERAESSERAAEALRADAERWRWWRMWWTDGTDDLEHINSLPGCDTTEELDAAIDAARSGAKEAGNG